MWVAEVQWPEPSPPPRQTHARRLPSASDMWQPRRWAFQNMLLEFSSALGLIVSITFVSFMVENSDQ